MRSLSFLNKMVESRLETGSVEVRFMTTNPKYSMTLIDPYHSNGRIIVEFIGYGTSQIHQRPHFELTPKEDGIWYEYFLHQFESLEKSSRIALSTTAQKETVFEPPSVSGGFTKSKAAG